MEQLMGLLLGTLQLFYPLLIASTIIFLYALFTRSWLLMLVSALLLYPDAWYFSGYPPFPWAKFIPLVQVIFAVIFFLQKQKRLSNEPK